MRTLICATVRITFAHQAQFALICRRHHWECHALVRMDFTAMGRFTFEHLRHLAGQIKIYGSLRFSLREGSGCDSEITLLLAILLPTLFVLILAAIIVAFLIRRRSQTRKNLQLQRFITDLYAEEGILTYYQDPDAISVSLCSEYILPFDKHNFSG